jgi:hypothetical protein
MKQENSLTIKYHEPLRMPNSPRWTQAMYVLYMPSIYFAFGCQGIGSEKELMFGKPKFKKNKPTKEEVTEQIIKYINDNWPPKEIKE